MNRHIYRIVGLSLILHTGSQAQFLINGSFEAPFNASGMQGIDSSNAATLGFTGWTIESGAVDLGHVGAATFHGSQGIDLAGNNGTGPNPPGTGDVLATLSQMVTLTPGQDYVLSFAHTGFNPSGSDTGNQGFEVLIDAASVFSVVDVVPPASGNFVWEEESIPFTAAATTTITIVGTVQSDTGISKLVDGFAITQVPEPSTATLVFGSCLVGTLRRRRRRGA